MFERNTQLSGGLVESLGRAAASAAASQTGSYRGPERRSVASVGTRLFALILDELDYGVLLLGEGSHVLHVNHAARADLDDDHPLQLLGRELRARLTKDVSLLHDALAGAQRGLRRWLTLGERDAPVCVSVVPLPALTDALPPATLLMMGKRRVCETLSVQWFARSHALTPAETRVLEALSEGLDPREVAEQHGVGLATVRTQIGSIRAKTATESIRELVQRVAVLPPMVSSLRHPS